MTPSSENRELARMQGAVDAWASTKGANVSLKSFDHEIHLWKRLTGMRRVGSVLEVGSGSGLFLMYLVAKGFAGAGTGIDPAVEGHGTEVEEIKRARRLALSLGLQDRVDFKQVSLESFMVEERGLVFDVIALRLCLHHIYERSQSRSQDEELVARCIKDLAELRSFLSDGGYLYIREEYAPSWIHGKALNLYHEWKGAPRINWSGKRSPRDWTDLIEKAGYSDVQTIALPPNRVTNSAWMKRLMGSWLSSSFLISAAK